MIATTMLCTAFGLLIGMAAALVAFAPSYEAPRQCAWCIGIWLATISVGLLVLAAHPQWFPH